MEFGVYDTFYFKLPEVIWIIWKKLKFLKDYEYLKTPGIAVISAKRRENPIQIPINTEVIFL